MDIRTKYENGAEWVFDSFRKLWVRATPEEKVRQWFCHTLTEALGYPEVAVANEVLVRVGGQAQRCDTLVYRAGDPVMVVEYKAPDVPLSARVFGQVARYNLTLRVPLMAVSNGRSTCCMRVAGRKTEFLSGLPSWSEILAL